MRIAVLGGGTAGFIAAAHFTRTLPQAQLLHIFDTNLPTIGVGEGTTPRFPGWFEETTGLGFPDLAARCGATLKRGTRFDGWGNAGSEFLHRFQPVRLIGYHFDAAELVRVLAEHVCAKQVDARVRGVAHVRRWGAGAARRRQRACLRLRFRCTRFPLALEPNGRRRQGPHPNRLDPHRASDPAAIVSATAVGSDPRRRTTPRMDLSNSTSRLDFLRVHLQSPHQLRCRGREPTSRRSCRRKGFPAGMTVARSASQTSCVAECLMAGSFRGGTRHASSSRLRRQQSGPLSCTSARPSAGSWSTGRTAVPTAARSTTSTGR